MTPIPSETWLAIYTRWAALPPGPHKQRVLGQLVAKFEPMIIGVVRRYPGLDEATTEDLQQAGRLGIMRAAEKFDPTKREAFPPYALLWVRSFVRRELRELRGLSKSGVPLDVDQFAAHIRITADSTPSAEEQFLQFEEHHRIMRWEADATVVVTTPRDPLRNAIRSERLKLVRRIDADEFAKRLAWARRRKSLVS